MLVKVTDSYLCLEANVFPQIKLVSIQIEVFLYIGVMHEDWVIIRYGEVTVTHHFFTGIYNGGLHYTSLAFRNLFCIPPQSPLKQTNTIHNYQYTGLAFIYPHSPPEYNTIQCTSQAWPAITSVQSEQKKCFVAIDCNHAIDSL